LYCDLRGIDGLEGTWQNTLFFSEIFSISQSSSSKARAAYVSTIVLTFLENDPRRRGMEGLRKELSFLFM
jgi:hypothetical protein